MGEDILGDVLVNVEIGLSIETNLKKLIAKEDLRVGGSFLGLLAAFLASN